MKPTIGIIHLIIWLTLYSHSVDIGWGQIDHPRGIVKKTDIGEIRSKIQTGPYKEFYENIRITAYEMEQKENINTISGHITSLSHLAKIQAYLYMLTGDKTWSEKSLKHVTTLVSDKNFFLDPVSRGLTRATILFNVAMSYDLCYESWSKEIREKIAGKLIPVIQSVSSNMGYDANYALESNWMGVRYATVLFASLVCDDFNTGPGERSILLPFEWDANKRLKEHIDANLNSNGWNVESMGYHQYNWSFIGPALMALQNKYVGNEDFALENYAPKAIHSVHALSTFTVAIHGRRGKGIKADLSDDHTLSSNNIMSMGLCFYPGEQKPAIQWMHDYLIDPELTRSERGEVIYSIICNNDISKINPERLGWLNYADEEQGVVLFRNRFRDQHDIVVTFTATSRRAHGHQGYDNLTFRIIGLGNIWVVGAGRTGMVQGQTNLFPQGDMSEMKGIKGITGELLDYHFRHDGSGYACGRGSCLGVSHHKRHIRVDYSPEGKMKALITVTDSSANGRTWRLNTPEFNEVKIQDNGFLIIAPDKSYLKAEMKSMENPIITTERVRYGGNTMRHNTGICLHGECYEYTTAIDVKCDQNIQIQMVLNSPNKLSQK